MKWTKDDLFLFNQGTDCCAFERLGAHLTSDGVNFSLWAPFVNAVSVVGSFSRWVEIPMERNAGDGGIWEVSIANAGIGDEYKYVIHTGSGEKIYKADPYGYSCQLRPGTNSRIESLEYDWNDSGWLASRGGHFSKPLNIYEVHLGSWKLPVVSDKYGEWHFRSYREIADELIPYVRDMGYTHIELLPVTEHPLDDSWGYQVTGYFAATSRYGRPSDLMYLVDLAHRNGIGVIMDWVPGHFCKNAEGLARFNGAPLYEAFEHKQWGTYVFDYARPQVRSFLLSNACFWISTYHFDGIRVDGVSSMLYLNFGVTDKSEKRFNPGGGEENLDAVSFLKSFNAMVGTRFPGVFTIAEESSAWPQVTAPPTDGGLGFHYKWDMGWMNDTLRYFKTDFPVRKSYHNMLTFSMMYAYSENFVLPLSHDEVVHLKNSLIGRMPGTYYDQFAQLRILAFYQMTHPGGKLNFMGNEIAQFVEWRFYEPLQWFLLGFESHRKHQYFIKELNHIFLDNAPFWERSYSPESFRWVDADNAAGGVLIYERIGGVQLTCVINLSKNDYGEFDIGVSSPGTYNEILSTDNTAYGGQGRLNGPVTAKNRQMHGRDYTVTIHLPELTAIILGGSNK